MNKKEKRTGEIVSYLICGVLTTLVNIVIYTLCYKYASLSNLLSNLFAWGGSVLFAFITNKIFVFESYTGNIKEVCGELLKFTAARVFTGGVDMVLMYVGVDVMTVNEIIMKVISNIVVIILNYVLSKFIVFRKKKEQVCTETNTD